MVRLELPIKILFLPLLAAFAGFVILGLWVASDGARSPGGVEASDVVDNIYAAIARCMNNSMFVSDVSFGEESRASVTSPTPGTRSSMSSSPLSTQFFHKRRLRIRQRGDIMDSRYKVLIVEDEEILRGLLTEVFENAGYVVASATNGAEALCQLSHQQPDIVLTDLMMPVMDGLEFCNRARLTSDVPIMVPSSLAEEQGRTASLLAGATAYARKSTAMEEILRQADNILAGNQG